MDMILVPSILHIDPLAFDSYPVGLKGRIRRMLMMHIAHGQALNTGVIKRNPYDA